MDWKAALAELQDSFAVIDLMTRPRSGSGMPELLIKEIQEIKIRMDACLNHARPHVHIDYKKEHHTASYAIDTGERIVGALGKKYDAIIKEWVLKHQDDLLIVWKGLRDSSDFSEALGILRA